MDADARADGFQASTRDGVVVAHLAPVTGDARPTVTAAAGDVEGDLMLAPSADLRDWIVAGIGEAAVGNAGPSQDASIAELMDGETQPSGRVALFARGRVFSNAQLSMAYDSGREKDPDALFRQVAPDRFFPIYGDTSQQGYDVETQGKLALRLDHPNGMLALGDFTTALPGGDLTRYDRALSGGVGRMDLGTLHSPQLRRVHAAVAGARRDPRSRHLRPLPAVAQAGGDQQRADRARDTRSLPPREDHRSSEMSRYADYDIDTTNGILLFKRPVPFHDDDMQPVVIVALYEVVGGSDEQAVAGGRWDTGSAIWRSWAAPTCTRTRRRRALARRRGLPAAPQLRSALRRQRRDDGGSSLHRNHGRRSFQRRLLAGRNPDRRPRQPRGLLPQGGEGFDNTSRGGLSDVGPSAGVLPAA